MCKNGEMTVEQMRAKREEPQSAFLKFTEAYRFFDTHAFCFYEGEDGKYYNLRVAEHWGANFFPLVAGKKQDVLDIMEKIKSDPLYENVCTMFFVDRDYDESLAGTNDDLFETPCYSIENLYARETVFARILKAEFGLHNLEPDYDRCLKDYNARLAEFNKIIVQFNAIVKYQHQYAPEIKCYFSSVKTSQLAKIEIGKVVNSVEHDSKIKELKLKLNPTEEILQNIEKELRQEKNPDLILRGKNQLDFLVAIVKELKRLNSTEEYFSKKLERVYIDLTKNRLSELSQYAITPPELKSFLERHRPSA